MVGRVHISVPKQTWVYLIILAVVIVGSIMNSDMLKVKLQINLSPVVSIDALVRVCWEFGSLLTPELLLLVIPVSAEWPSTKSVTGATAADVRDCWPLAALLPGSEAKQ